MNKQQKQQRLERYDEVLQNSGYAILTEFNKMPVHAVERFREQLRELGCSCIVMKNTLARISFEKNSYEEVCEVLVGPSMLFYGDEEIAPVAKAIAKFIKSYPGMVVKTIIFDNNIFPKEQFSAFTSLPTKNEVRAKLLSVLKAPQSQFVGVINTASRIVGVLSSYAAKKA